jgi:uncharacterized cupredoxin-like copper-binding protein
MIPAALGLAVIVIAAIAALNLTGRGRTPSAAIDLLAERLARGEISTSEHRERHGLLTEAPEGRASGGVLWVAGGLGALLLVAGLFTAIGNSGLGRWAGHPMSMGDHMGWSRTATAPASPPDPGGSDVVVEAGDMWFAPERVEIEAGMTTNLILDNTGRVFHDLSIPDLGVRLEAGAGETASTAIRSPEAGSYGFLCTVPGHASAGMTGQLVVTAGS